MYFVYILISINHPKTYVGITSDLNRRLRQHNSGYHFYTKKYLPWKIKYQEQVDTRQEARKKEKYLKSAAGRRWMKKNVFNN